MLINLVFPGTQAQAQSDLSGPVKYEARDSIVADIPRQIVILYGDAYVNYEGIELRADYIEINLQNNEVLATYSSDSLGNPVGKPIFTSEGEESRCDLVKYNFKTKTGYIREVRAQQDEGYIHMAESKIHPNEQIHLKNGKFTTCENDTPHYHFKLTKAIIVPDERVVTGPVYMKIGKVPTPLAAPFAFFPSSDTRKHGIIIPQFAGHSQYGFGLQDFGYYIPLGEYWETQFNGTIYTTGRFGVGNTTNYYKKYKYRGSFNAKFEQFRGYFYDTTLQNKVSFRWVHSQDPKAHPSIKFSSDINYQSDNNGKSSLDSDNPNYFNNTFNSSVKLSKSWKTRKLNGSASLNNRFQQNSQTQRYNLDLPTFNFQVSQFDLGVFRRNDIGKKWYEEIKVRYSLNAANSISIADSVFNRFDIGEINDYALSGIKQAVTVNSNLKIFGSRFTFSPSVDYSELWNFQYETHNWVEADHELDTTEHRGLGASRTLGINGALGFGFYGMYRFKGERETRFKHVMTNSVSFSFRPDISSYQEIDTTGGQPIYISPFYASKYREGGRGQSGLISWNSSNSLKMKTRDMNDTINETDKSFNLIDAFSIRGSYDVIKDSFQLSDQALTFRTSKFLKIFNIQSTASLSPYTYDTLNIKSKEYAWNSKQGLGTFTNMTLTVNANFTSKMGRKKQKEIQDATDNNAEVKELATDPYKVNFDIPWQLNTAYNLKYSLNQNKDSITERNYNVVQTLVLTGDFSINDKWKVRGGMSLNLQQLLPYNHNTPEGYKYPYEDLVSTYNFEIWRDLHCWEAVLQFRQYGPVVKDAMGNWGPFDGGSWRATNWTFLFRVNIKASMFQDIKLEYNQPPFIF
ncbi:MAG: LPS-assembly protein LptD [Crocinitomicaceae bacterium]|nr:LPS-assembly protein LptD [Crocinitomicaceae bacterium]